MAATGSLNMEHGVEQRTSTAAMDIVPPPIDAASREQRDHYLAIPAHAVRDSLFHSQSKFHDFRGLVNLGLMCLVAACFRVALENVTKYVLTGAWVKPSVLLCCPDLVCCPFTLFR